MCLMRLQGTSPSVSLRRCCSRMMGDVEAEIADWFSGRAAETYEDTLATFGKKVACWTFES